jgi:hypothetical protein
LFLFGAPESPKKTAIQNIFSLRRSRKGIRNSNYISFAERSEAE